MSLTSTSEVLEFARRMAAELRELEWKGEALRGTETRFCTWCDSLDYEGHTMGCQWLVLMAEAKRLGLLEKQDGGEGS